jgi:hypothetical protein
LLVKSGGAIYNSATEQEQQDSYPITLEKRNEPKRPQSKVVLQMAPVVDALKQGFDWVLEWELTL